MRKHGSLSGWLCQLMRLLDVVAFVATSLSSTGSYSRLAFFFSICAPNAVGHIPFHVIGGWCVLYSVVLVALGYRGGIGSFPSSAGRDVPLRTSLTAEFVVPGAFDCGPYANGTGLVTGPCVHDESMPSAGSWPSDSSE